jgi:hypothetical protein
VLERLKLVLSALFATILTGSVVIAFAQGSPDPSAAAAGGIDAGAPTEPSACETRLLAPLKTYSELRAAPEWPEEKKADPRSIVICGLGCMDAGLERDAGKVDAGSKDLVVAAKPETIRCERVANPDGADTNNEKEDRGESDEAEDEARSENERDAGAPANGYDEALAHSASSSAYTRALETFAHAVGGVRVIIATVADPTDSGLQYYFDQQVESLELAIERDGHARDQSWLPWADTQASDEKKKTSEACRRDVPGVIVFRPKKAGGEVVLLLLVGETPTYGVQKGALARAIDIHRTLKKGAPLRVVGPTFSGSASSLRKTLDSEWECDARVVSGSATSRATADILRQWNKKSNRRNDFELTTIPADELQCAVLRREARIDQWWLDFPADGATRVVKGFAMLRESGTTFGYEGGADSTSLKQKSLPPGAARNGDRSNSSSGSDTSTNKEGSKKSSRSNTKSHSQHPPTTGAKTPAATTSSPTTDAGTPAANADAGARPSLPTPRVALAPADKESSSASVSDAGAPDSGGGGDAVASAARDFDDDDDGADPLVFECPFRADVDLRFPLHISSVRDAYETRDEQRSRGQHGDGLAARKTTLDFALHERAQPRDIQFETSVKTPLARDLVITQLLGAIARENIRTVGIQATDSADVIFLARKIRVVAPDVRIVIFDNDVLYTHPSLHGDLLGSYVVTPYPFFGTNNFARARDAGHSHHWWSWLWFTPDEKKAEEPPEHIPFSSALAEGTYNAALAVSRRRGSAPDYLFEYTFFRKKGRDSEIPPPPPLPIWIGAIGSGGVVPVAVRRPLDCGNLIHGGRLQDDDDRRACSSGHQPDEMRARLALGQYVLRVDPDVTPPNFWQFLFAALMLFSAFDAIHGSAARKAMKSASTDPSGSQLDEREVDLRTLRQTYDFYATTRQVVLFGALLTLLVIQSLAIATYGDQLVARKFPILLLFIGIGSTIASAFGLYRSVRRHLRRRRELHVELRRRRRQTAKLAVAERAPIPRFIQTLWRRVADTLGFNAPNSTPAVLRHTLNQTRFLAFVVLGLTVPLLVLLLWAVETLDPKPFSIFAIGHATNPNVAMFVLRTLPLATRLSPAAPILLTLLAFYLWASGRSSRIRTLYRVSAMTPASGAGDGVCTPITHILHDSNKPEAVAMRAAERALGNSLARPSHSPIFFFTMMAITILPVVAFVMKPPRTLENPQLSGVLVVLLALSAVVVVSTVVQLGLYWRSFSRLLDRIQVHPTAESFGGIPRPLKESLDAQVSRSQDDALRFAACVRRFSELHDTQDELGAKLPAPIQQLAWQDMVRRMQETLTATQSPRPLGWTLSDAHDGGPIGRELVDAASAIRGGLQQIWDGQWGKPQIGDVRPVDKDDDVEPNADAMTRFESAENDKAAVAWLRRAHAFVASVVALVLNRHVRQFRVFLYSSTGAALCLLAALSSYVFQPQRLFLTCIWIVMGSVVALSLWVYAQLDRNSVLSRISSTRPGRVELDASFAVRIFGWVALPLLSVVVAQYPELATHLSSWLEPFLNALK